MSDSVLVLGGGFAGFWAAMAARRVGGAALSVTLISRDPILQIRPRLYEAEPETLAIDLRPLLQSTGIQFVTGEAVRIEADQSRVVLATGEVIAYSRLVVTTGSRMRRPPIPGAESVYSIDTLAEAVLFDRHLKQVARATSAPAIAVIGAGFTGLELALELRDRLQVHGGDAVSKNARIHLIERADAPGPELGDGPRGAIEAAIHDARIQLHLGTRVTALGPQRVVLGEGDIETDAVVLTTGMVAADFANSIAGAHDNLGRVIVDRELRAPAQPHVFVAGDSAAADVGDGHLALQSCQHAMQMGRVAGENAARELLGQPLLPYSQLRYVTCLDLGRSGAVLTQGWDRSVVSVGESAKNTKRWINQTAIYPPKDASPETLIASSKIEQR